MIDRSLRIALGISLGVHIFAMSAVIIVVPDKIGRNKSFTRVDFLGPILEKTAFDIMLENATPAVETSYSLSDAPFDPDGLEVSSPGRVLFEPEFPLRPENSMDNAVMQALIGYKIMPDFYLDVIEEVPRQRSVIYAPEPPLVMKDLYGGKDVIEVKVRALVSPEGSVRKAEPVTTTGYPKLDILAVKYVRSWMFEASGSSEDKWIVLDVKLDTKD
jgi:hypothetical protein